MNKHLAWFNKNDIYILYDLAKFTLVLGLHQDVNEFLLRIGLLGVNFGNLYVSGGQLCKICNVKTHKYIQYIQYISASISNYIMYNTWVCGYPRKNTNANEHKHYRPEHKYLDLLGSIFHNNKQKINQSYSVWAEIYNRAKHVYQYPFFRVMIYSFVLNRVCAVVDDDH